MFDDVSKLHKEDFFKSCVLLKKSKDWKNMLWILVNFNCTAIYLQEWKGRSYKKVIKFSIKFLTLRECHFPAIIYGKKLWLVRGAIVLQDKLASNYKIIPYKSYDMGIMRPLSNLFSKSTHVQEFWLKWLLQFFLNIILLSSLLDIYVWILAPK